MARKTKPANATTETASNAAKLKLEAETRDLRQRMERLEQRLEKSIFGDDELASIEQGVDRNPSGDTLQRAVRRSNIKRGSRKA